MGDAIARQGLNLERFISNSSTMTANEIGKGYQTYLSNNWSESEIDMNSSDEEEQ